MWFTGGTVSGGVTFGLSDLKGLLQSKQFYESVCTYTQRFHKVLFDSLVFTIFYSH